MTVNDHPQQKHDLFVSADSASLIVYMPCNYTFKKFFKVVFYFKLGLVLSVETVRTPSIICLSVNDVVILPSSLVVLQLYYEMCVNDFLSSFTIFLNAVLKSDSHLPKKNLFYLLQCKPFKNDEKCFLFHLKISFRSQDIEISVLTFWPCRTNNFFRKASN